MQLALPGDAARVVGQWREGLGLRVEQLGEDVVTRGLAQAAVIVGCPTGELTIRDGSIERGGKPTGQDYWTLAGAVNLAVKATGSDPQ